MSYDYDVDPRKGARFNRPLQNGLHEGSLVEVSEKVSGAGNAYIELQFVIDGTPETAPEGPVKVSLAAMPGKFSLANAVEHILGKTGKGKIDAADFQAKLGTLANIRTEWEEATLNTDGTVKYKPKAKVVRLERSRGATKAAAEADPFA